jgi:hypothetical protein
MGTREDPKRTIFGPAVIEMNPYCDHLSEYLGGRLNLPHAGLLRPPHETRNIETLVDRNDTVLVPEQRPVCIRNLIKENRPHREGSAPQDSGRKLSDTWFHRQYPYGRTNLQ